MRYAFVLLLLAACGMGAKTVTMNDFYSVDVNMSETEVVAMLGKPYSTKKNTDGSVEYEYVERIKIGGRDAETRYYFITLKNGQVVSKHLRQTIPLPYGFDSYDMQTTSIDNTQE